VDATEHWSRAKDERSGTNCVNCIIWEHIKGRFECKSSNRYWCAFSLCITLLSSTLRYSAVWYLIQSFFLWRISTKFVIIQPTRDNEDILQACTGVVLQISPTAKGPKRSQVFAISGLMVCCKNLQNTAASRMKINNKINQTVQSIIKHSSRKLNFYINKVHVKHRKTRLEEE